MKANLGMSKYGQIPVGLDLVAINLPGNPFNGKTIGQVVAYADTFLTWHRLLSIPTATAADLATLIADLNCSFAGPIDTLDGGGFAGGVHFTGVKPISEVSWLYRPTSVIPPVAQPTLDFNTLAEVPEKFELRQNYPNPFNPTTTIEFNLAEDALVTVKIFNLLGQEVAILADHQEFTEGANDVEFNASSMASGVYFYRILVSDIATGAMKFHEVKKMMLIK